MPKPTTYDYKGWFAPTDDLFSPIWVLRLCPITALLCLLLAESAFPSGFAHGLCLGMAAGQLLLLTLQVFQITSITIRRPDDRSNVDNLTVTR